MIVFFYFTKHTLSQKGHTSRNRPGSRVTPIVVVSPLGAKKVAMEFLYVIKNMLRLIYENMVKLQLNSFMLSVDCINMFICCRGHINGNVLKSNNNNNNKELK